MIGGMLMCISFPAIVDEWVELGSLHFPTNIQLIFIRKFLPLIRNCPTSCNLAQDLPYSVQPSQESQ